LCRPGPGRAFDAPSSLPYQAPRFDIIKDGDYQPGFEKGMQQQLAEIASSPTTRRNRLSTTPSWESNVQAGCWNA